MTFKNEYVQKLEYEASTLLNRAREKYRVGFSAYDMWTVDRENDAVLVRTGCGHSLESANTEMWGFMDKKGSYAFATDVVHSSVAPDGTLRMERSIGFTVTRGVHDRPDASSIRQIKLALEEHKDSCVLSKYKKCDLTLKIGGKATRRQLAEHNPASYETTRDTAKKAIRLGLLLMICGVLVSAWFKGSGVLHKDIALVVVGEVLLLLGLYLLASDRSRLARTTSQNVAWITSLIVLLGLVVGINHVVVAKRQRLAGTPATQEMVDEVSRVRHQGE